jgi:hypothetical protein
MKNEVREEGCSCSHFGFSRQRAFIVVGYQPQYLKSCRRVLSRSLNVVFLSQYLSTSASSNNCFVCSVMRRIESKIGPSSRWHTVKSANVADQSYLAKSVLLPTLR